MSTYFVIYNTEDGAIIKPFDYYELKQALVNKDHDEFLGFRKKFMRFDELDDEHFTRDWGEDDVLIIKGEVIMPTPVKQVVEYEID